MKKYRFGIAIALALVALVVGHQLVQQHRYSVAVKVMSELVEAIRSGQVQDVRQLDDDHGLDRTWMQSHFTVLCDLVPPFSWTRYECVAQFDRGGAAAADVDTKSGRTYGARVYPPKH